MATILSLNLITVQSYQVLTFKSNRTWKRIDISHYIRWIFQCTRIRLFFIVSRWSTCSVLWLLCIKLHYVCHRSWPGHYCGDADAVEDQGHFRDAHRPGDRSGVLTVPGHGVWGWRRPDGAGLCGDFTHPHCPRWLCSHVRPVRPVRRLRRLWLQHLLQPSLSQVCPGVCCSFAINYILFAVKNYEEYNFNLILGISTLAFITVTLIARRCLSTPQADGTC